ncbi:MAG TPA: xanthine dehydrogenase family protein subunit M [Candidatus Acidoferrales bacterium]|nr:xanthine dehydrogenase family protein subunit M [Candidatus Acidoferrales bacterium]
MIPAAFEYFAPKSLDEALRLVDRHGGEAKLLAGGHSLLPLMKLRLAAPRYVIDLGRVRALRSIREEGGRLVVGALATHADIESSDLVRLKCPLLAETASEIGDVQVRNRGTIGGSLAHADPAADYPAAVLALDAEIVAASNSATRTIPAAEFFVDLLTTALRPGEILTEIRLPVAGRQAGAAYRKLHQPASGFALVGIAARLSLDSAGRIVSIGLGVTGVAVRAYRATAAEQALASKKPNPKLVADAAAKVAEGVEPLADIHASAAYRRASAAVYARRAIEAALLRAAGKKT